MKPFPCSPESHRRRRSRAFAWPNTKCFLIQARPSANWGFYKLLRSRRSPTPSNGFARTVMCETKPAGSGATMEHRSNTEEKQTWAQTRLIRCCVRRTRVFSLFGLALFTAAMVVAQPAPRWWKGNLHTHTLWSDGDDYPEMVVDWYKSHGYDFLALSDHNIVQEGNWVTIATNSTRALAALPKYLRRFGSNWVEQTQFEGNPAVRLKTLDEFRRLFEAPNRFLLIRSEEITDKFGGWPIHVIASNLRDLIKPRHGHDIIETMQNN